MPRKSDADVIAARASRRNFLKLGAMAAAAMSTGAASRSLAAPLARSANQWPGRIVLLRDPSMNGQGTPDPDRIESRVHLGVRELTGITDTGAATEALFPGVHSASTFAIKVNCIGPTCTRWEAARGIVSSLSLMFGGSYDVSQVVIYDRHYLPGYGYLPERFTFNGNCPLISSTNNPSSSYYVYGSHRLSQYLIDCDYVINLPALKSHSDYNNQITVALKNHYGSCSPSSLCGNIPGMLTVNADTNVRDKTYLILTDALRGTYNGGPGTAPMSWNTFPEGSPNTLFFTTDPTTNEYWGRDYINAERALHGLSDKPCPWVEESAGDPWNLGICEPDAMDVIHHTVSAAPEPPSSLPSGTFLAACLPNPVVDQAHLRFRLAHAGAARLVISDATGRTLRHLAAGEFPAGYSEVRWDGRDESGRRPAAGVYFVRLETPAGAQVQRVILAR